MRICALLILSSAIFISCGTKETPVDEIKFNVNYDLLGELTFDQEHKISYRLPKHFSAFNLELPNLSIDSTSSPLAANGPRLMFKSDSADIIISILKLDSDKSEVKALYDHPSDSLNQSGYWQDIAVAEFRFNNIDHVFQFLLTNNQLVNFRLLFENDDDEYLQIDCISSQEHYRNNIRLFESFFGSILRID